MMVARCMCEPNPHRPGCPFYRGADPVWMDPNGRLATFMRIREQYPPVYDDILPGTGCNKSCGMCTPAVLPS